MRVVHTPEHIRFSPVSGASIPRPSQELNPESTKSESSVSQNERASIRASETDASRRSKYNFFSKNKIGRISLNPSYLIEHKAIGPNSSV